MTVQKENASGQTTTEAAMPWGEDQATDAALAREIEANQLWEKREADKAARQSQTTEIENRNEYTNLVRKVTTVDVLAEVRHAFLTTPAPDFHEWLTRRLEQAERMP